MGRILTNKYGLAETLVRAAKYDNHKVSGDISVSALIDAPRIRLLKRRHNYSEDVSDLLEAMLGSGLHKMIESASIDNVRKEAFQLTMETLLPYVKEGMDEKKKDSLVRVIEYLKKFSDAILKVDDRYIYEQTLRLEVDGMILFGTFDLYDTLLKFLEDYKSTKTWTWVFPESREKWKAQTNVYAFLLRHHGYEVNGIVINALFKDWTANHLHTNKDYPKQKIMRIGVDMWDPAKAAAYISERIKIHKEAEGMTDDNLPLCTGLERWAKADQWAMKTPKAKKSLRNFDVKSMAISWAEENQHRHKGLYIEYRPGDSQRCASYCPVAEFCNQRKAELEFQKKEADNE